MNLEYGDWIWTGDRMGMGGGRKVWWVWDLKIEKIGMGLVYFGYWRLDLDMDFFYCSCGFC